MEKDSFEPVSVPDVQELSIGDKNALIAHIFDIKTNMAIMLDHIIEMKNLVSCKQEFGGDDLLPKFPINSIRDLIDIDKYLSENEVVAKQMGHFIYNIGGKNSKDAVYRALERLYTNYIGQYISWTGAKGNFKIKDMKLTAIMREVIRQRFENVTDMEFESMTKSWFQHAKTRYERTKK
ncbi:uncharacterized protein LOC115890423 [Sitophilus oryzae]|uniref:Uncharacterized protein LOC115890423 n=1 Tax=Sitophilus oryzae TaxID=7048 RepID=A0A6J2YTA2_SITOR|nr:uncharacterized protein LOC115890423 [Sitophilus oryzae]